MSRARLPVFVTDTRRTSASSSGETTTSRVVVIAASLRMNSARSSLKLTSIAVRLGAAWLVAGRPEGSAFDVAQKAIAAPSSQVGSSRQRVTPRSRQRL